MFRRILCILQLCLGFIVLLWLVLYPFLGTIYYYKSQQQIYESVFQQAAFFESLPQQEKERLLQKYDKLNKLATESKGSIASKFYSEIPIYKYCWIVFSILIPIFLLLKKEGANEIVWLLPILCLLLFEENISSEKSFSTLPSEDYIFKNYVQEPIAPTISGQFEQLKRGWANYLIVEFSKETPSIEPKIFEEQKVRAQFHFNVAKLKETPIVSLSKAYEHRHSHWELTLFALWNCFFAFLSRYSEEQKISKKACQVSY